MLTIAAIYLFRKHILKKETNLRLSLPIIGNVRL